MNLTSPRPHGAQGHQPGEPGRRLGKWLSDRGYANANDDAAERTAATLAALSGTRLDEGEKHRGGIVAHYAFGVSCASLYGGLAEVLPDAARGWGLPFGTLLWAGADEGLMPLLGLSKGPREYSLAVHSRALLGHLVFGWVTEVTRRALRAHD